MYSYTLRETDIFFFIVPGLVGRPAFVPYLAGGASSDGTDFKVSASIREGAELAARKAQTA